MDKPRFARAIAVLAEAFRQKCTETTIRAYEFGLSDLTIEAIEKAVTKAIGQCKFMPVPAELRELSGELRPEARAAMAWAVVIDAVRRFGYYKSVYFDDPTITATIRNLWHTWEQFDDALEAGDETWLRKDFERVYKMLYQSGVSAEDALPLLGAHERNNATKGYASKAALLIESHLPLDHKRLPKPIQRPRITSELLPTIKGVEEAD